MQFLAKLHDMYLYKTAIFPHQPLKSVLKVAFLQVSTIETISFTSALFVITTTADDTLYCTETIRLAFHMNHFFTIFSCCD